MLPEYAYQTKAGMEKSVEHKPALMDTCLAHGKAYFDKAITFLGDGDKNSGSHSLFWRFVFVNP